MTSPVGQRPDADYAPKKISGQCRHIRFTSNKVGARTAGATMCKTRQPAIRWSAPVSFFRRVIWSPPAQVAFRPQRQTIQNSPSTRCSLIRGLIFDVQDSRVNNRTTRNTYIALDPNLPRSPRHCRSGSVTPVAAETVICGTRALAVSNHCPDHRPTQARRCNNPQNSDELPIAYGIGGRP